MLCQHCGKNEATTHVKRNINGEVSEYMLCHECAKEMGYGNLFSDFHSDWSNLLGSFFSNALPARTGATRCPTCGSTMNDIARSGMVGCADCYETFYNELLPTIRNVHGNTHHCGKRPILTYTEEDDASASPSENPAEDTVARLKEELQQAINEQNFEHAAELRDEINRREAQS